jgi:hypothetical protein
MIGRVQIERVEAQKVVPKYGRMRGGLSQWRNRLPRYGRPVFRFLESGRVEQTDDRAGARVS